MNTDLAPYQGGTPEPYNPPCEKCGTTLVSTTYRDVFGPGYHYYSLRCLTCRPIAEVQNR